MSHVYDACISQICWLDLLAHFVSMYMLRTLLAFASNYKDQRNMQSIGKSTAIAARIVHRNVRQHQWRYSTAAAWDLMSPPSTATPSGPSTSYRNTASPISTSRSTASSSSEDIGDGEPIGDAASIAPAGTPAPSAFDGQLGIQEAQGGAPHDWSRSFHGLSYEPFRKEAAQVLQAPIDPLDIEVKPGMSTPLKRFAYGRYSPD